MKKILFLILSAFAFSTWAAVDLTPLESIAVQEGGRKKPLLTYAQESVQKLLGRATWTKSGTEKLSAMEVLMSMLFNQQEDWDNAQIIRCAYLPFKEKIGLPADERFFSINELRTHTNLLTIVEEARKHQMQPNPELTKIESEAQDLMGKILALQELVSGSGLRIIPDPSKTNGKWLPVNEAVNYYPGKEKEILEDFRGIVSAYQANDSSSLASAAEKFKALVRSLSPNVYPPESILKLEVNYNHLHPFRIAWIVYVLAFIVMLMATREAGSMRSKMYWPAYGLYLIGLGLQIYGFVLRCYIAGRPPVTNMYEVMIWVAFGAAFFAFIFETIYRPRYFILAASVVSTLSLVLADNLPAVLDPSIRTLAPVLVNNYWLTVHVLTINLGYAGFMLALGIGHIALGYYIFRPSQAAKISELTQFNYRAMQVGLLFLTAGTILGGVWANDSWGRFWGWDPKETWALISILCYLAVLHGRFSGWLGDFALNVASVLCFQAIIFAAYGVNFVLGKGLHSYGRGVGGEWAVGSYVLAELIAVGFAVWRYKLQTRADIPAPFRERTAI